MDGGTLVVAPWGDPARWRYASYLFEGEARYRRVESFTSLAAIAAREGGRTVVFALDSLVEYTGRGPVRDYGEVLERVARYVRRYLCGVEAEVEVLPGVIRTLGVEVEGRILDYYVLSLRAVLARLLEDRNREVVVDITHGVNFMPTLTYRAAREAAALASLLTGSVGLKVYNADPIGLPGYKDDPCRRSLDDPCRPRDPEICAAAPLTVRLAVKERLTPLHALAFIDHLLGEARERPRLPSLRPVGEPDARTLSLLGRVNRGLEGVVGDALRLLRLARHGLTPLLAARAAGREGDPERYREAFEEAAEAWSAARTVGPGEVTAWLTVKSRLGFDSGAVALLYAWAVAEAAREALAGEGPSLAAAWRLAERLYRGTSTLKTVQDREKTKLKAALEKRVAGHGCQPGELGLKSLYSDAPTREGLTGCDVFKRDLVAHGGWHTDVIVLSLACRGQNVDYEATRVGVRGGPVCREGREERSVWDVVDSL